ncbi:MAG: HsdR family type I site-specific deoxyribonuclease, partial [Muribaculum sp.]|nr:HsdR family type I site-specific deoxyribonuclease [Muribaculum sp.]
FHIELKKSGVDVSQAANQIEKYSREGIFSQGLFSLVQVFVAMNPDETLYFANPGPEGTFNKDFYFHWADFRNEPINDWNKVIERLLSIPMAHQMIGFYTVPDSKDGVLKVMRSYQYYAADAIRTTVAKTHWEDNKIFGGYVWHTTGSGKTMTSFKAAQLIAQSGDADKVVFLMDRIELGTQSLEEYRGFAGDGDSIEGTDNTRDLVDKLISDDAGLTLIVSSIQKMGLVYEHKPGDEGGFTKSELDKIRSKRIVFIIDECHRSTFGDTLAGIKNNFPGALYFGFTGTPIADENNVRDMTTRDLFGDRLHLYSIADGIRDGNVLGFDTYKVLTMRDSDVRQTVALSQAKAATIEEALADEQKAEVYNRFMAMPMINNERDPQTGRYLKGVEDYLDNAQYRREEHRAKVVEDIMHEFPRKSWGGKFHAILATSSIPEAISYYRLLREKMPELKITAIFDPSIDNNGQDRAAIKEEALVEILSQYNEWFGQSFSIASWQLFKKDVAKRMAHKKPYQRISREQQLDIMIVVDQMLTGFDSKYVNTIYMDKELAYADLIQAFSRTNRLFGHEKRFGIIRFYRRPHRMQRNIEDAFQLYAHGKPEGIFVLKIGENVSGMNFHYNEIKYMFEHAGIQNFASLPEDNTVRARFAKEWKALNARLDAAKMQGFVWSKKRYKYDDAEGNRRSATIQFDEPTYLTLAQRYKELFIQTGPGPQQPHGGEVPFEIEPYLTEIDTGVIDSAYMNSRFQKYLEAFYSDEQQATIDDVLKELHGSFAHLSAEEQKYANIFLSDIQSGRLERSDIDPEKSLSDYIADYRAQAKNDQIHRFAEALGVNEDKLRFILGLHLPEDNINRSGHYAELAASLDKTKATFFFERVEGKTVPTFMIPAKADKMLRRFITRGGFDIDDVFDSASYTPDYKSDNQTDLAAEPYEIYQRHDVDKTVLIGCYRDKKHLEWILANKIYNIRLGKRKGSAEDKPECFSLTDLLYLYDVRNLEKVSVFKIVAHKEMLGQELKQMDYPGKSPGKSYMTFKIEKIEDAADTLNINVREILSNIENHTNGA